MKQHALLILCGLVACVFLVFPSSSVTYLSGLTQWVVSTCDDAFIVFASAILLLCLGLSFSPVGKKRLGEGEPEFGFFSWLAMLFTAGMGSGLVFWGVAEPVFHLANTPNVHLDGHSAENTALALTYFHWGFHAWSLYAITGLIIAWFVFMEKRPMRISSVFNSTQIQSTPKSALWLGVDLLAVLAIVFGLAGTLANSVALLETGIEQRFALSFEGKTFGIGMTLLMTLGFGISLSLGLARGIKRLSQFNVVFMCLLLLGVIFSGDVVSLLERMVGSSFAYIQLLPQVSFSVIDGSSQWSQGWTVIYLIWWIAWAPFVGPFIARISQGRTIRQFLLCTIFIPTLASIVWFSSFGDAVFNAVNRADILAQVNQQYTLGLFALLDGIPLGAVLSVMALLLLVTFVITSADSAIYVTCLFTDNVTLRNKLAWIAVLLAISLALVSINNVDLNKQIAISGAIPFTLVLIAKVVYLLMSFVSRKTASAN